MTSHAIARSSRTSFSSFSSGETLGERWNGSAKRIDSSNTASDEREKVSHYQQVRIGSSMNVPVAHFLAEEDVIILPVLADAESFMQATILVRLFVAVSALRTERSYVKLPANNQGASMKLSVRFYGADVIDEVRTHEVLVLEILGDLLVPERDISLVIVHDGTQFCVAGKVGHELVHALDALDEIDNLVFLRLLVQGANSVVDSLAENRRQAHSHSRMCEGVLVVATVRRPWRVVGVNLCALSTHRVIQ